VAMETGIYIPEGSDCRQKYWNIGIRIEDDVVVTDEGRSVLSAFAPQSVTDIETLMKKKGIGNQSVGRE
jgi:Xaa-Pro aminopeptidase